MSSLCVRGKASLENSQESNKEKNESRDRWKLLFADVGSSFYDASSICCHSRSSTVRSPGSGIESSATHRSTSHHRNTAITHLSHTRGYSSHARAHELARASTSGTFSALHSGLRQHKPNAFALFQQSHFIQCSPRMKLEYSVDNLLTI